MRRNTERKFFFRNVGREISIRNRVTGLFLLVTASLMIIVFVLIYVQVESDVYSHVDEELNEEAGEFLEGLEVTGSGVLFKDQTEWMERSHITVDFYPKFVQIVTAGSTPEIVRRSFNLFSDTLRYDPSLGEIAFYNSSIAGASVRQVQVPVFHGKMPEQQHGCWLLFRLRSRCSCSRICGRYCFFPCRLFCSFFFS